jgi:hypothetical protein
LLFVPVILYRSLIAFKRIDGRHDMTTTNRETWLNDLASKMAPTFAEHGFPLPALRVSIGWPSAGKDAPIAGECWDKSVSADGHFEIFLNPSRADSLAVGATLAHELIHAAVGFDQGHKGNFAKVALSLGFARPLTHVGDDTPEKLAGWLRPMLDEVGELPHAAINYSRQGATRVKRGSGGVVQVPGPDSDDSESGNAPINTRPPKQGTRLLKAMCAHEECGYTVRVTSKWLEIGPPHCPVHGAMAVEE